MLCAMQGFSHTSVANLSTTRLFPVSTIPIFGKYKPYAEKNKPKDSFYKPRDSFYKPRDKFF